MTWFYKGMIVRSHDDLLEDTTDIVYQITYMNGQKYIGKKAVRAVRKKPPLKGKKRARRILTNLPFINYEGSSDAPRDLEIRFKKILYQCSSRKTSTYLETHLLFSRGVLFDEDYLNENIGGKFFANSLDGLSDEDKQVFLYDNF